jgi:hypothetical protein
MKIRIPGWVQNQVVPSDLYQFCDKAAGGYTVEVNGKAITGIQLENGYLPIKRQWKKGDVVRIHFDMPVRTVVANGKVKADKGRIAVERGPLVYCAEWADNQGINPHHVLMGGNPQFGIDPAYTIQNTEADGKPFQVTAITANAQEAVIDGNGRLSAKDVKVRLIPYYAWNHRGAGIMDVWLARSLRGLDD